MKSRPKPGLTGELKLTVEQRHCIDFASGGMPTVFSTPFLIGLLERTARESLAPLLEENERTVGVEVDIRHLAPTPLGAMVTLSTRVIHVDGSFVTFHVEAHDEVEMIARGIHKRAIIRVESFAKRVQRKLPPK
jgi:predicted thioesterase